MADVLILGGTRNLGHFTALELLGAGHRVTVLNRGRTADDLPAEVTKLRADRRDSESMRAALADLMFDLVLDTTTYTGADARQAVELFSGRTDRFVFVSSGQVYLVREDIARPFREDDYAGSVMAEPERGTPDHEGWKYGVDKRDAEDVFSSAALASGFPVTTLRLPMVASERDERGRIQAYVARIMDRGPIMIPDDDGLPLRHVYVMDVARLVRSFVGSDTGIGLAFNVSCGESMSLAAFIETLSGITGIDAQIERRPRAELEQAGLLPHCSPFSGRWMSELDNSRSIDELESIGLRYTAPEAYLRAIADDYESRWCRSNIVPAGLDQRKEEIIAAYPRT
jgi:nucleoside-diphosphate-sugar epimerase